MKTISIEGTQHTPSITFDTNKGVLEIKGRSITDDAIKFYKPLLDHIDKYARKPHTKTTITIQLEYIHINSSKCILELFKKLETIHKLGSSKVTIYWYYENEDMLEAGKDYGTIVKLPFKMIEIV